MTITDDRVPRPRHRLQHRLPTFAGIPILAAFGVLSGLSLFSALWPVSAIVIGVAVAGHATGLDRAALLLAERLAARDQLVRAPPDHAEPGPTAPAPAPPEPSAPAPVSTCAARRTAPAAPAALRAATPAHDPAAPGRAVPPRSSRPCAHSAGERPESPSETEERHVGVERSTAPGSDPPARCQPSRARASRSRCSDLSLPRNSIASITGSPAGAPRMAT